jgi:hypothetical protein
LPLLRGTPRGPSDEPLTFQQRFNFIKDEAYGWPLLGLILEEISPRPRAMMGAMISIPRRRGP